MPAWLRTNSWLGPAIAVVLLVAIAGLDAERPATTIVSAFLLPPLLLAFVAPLRWVAAVGGFAITLALLSGFWNHSFATSGYYVTAVAVAIGSFVSIVVVIIRIRVELAGRELGVLAAVADVMDGTLPLGTALGMLADELVPTFGDICIFDVVRDGALERALVRAHGRRAEWLETVIGSRRLSPADAPTGSAKALASGEPQMLVDVEDDVLRGLAHDDDDLGRLREISPRSVIVVPLAVADRALGALTLITADSGRRLGNDDFRFLAILAGRVSLALDNAGLFRELSSVEQRLDAVLASLADAVTVQDASGRLVYANQAAAELLDAATPEELLRTPNEELVARFLTETEDGRPLDVDRLPGRQALRGETVDPLLVRAVNRRTGEERWQMVKATAVGGDGEGPRLAVNIMEDVTETKRAELRQRLLAEAGRILASSLDYEQTLQQVAEMAVPRFADWCAVNVPGKNGVFDQVAIAHVDPAKIEFANRIRARYPSSMDAPGAGEVLATGEPQMMKEISDELLRAGARDAEHYELIRSIGLRSVIMVPMRVAGETAGVITFVTAESQRRFDEHDLEVAEELARRAGTAVENARLYRQQKEVARTLERAFEPPRLPQMDGWETSTLYQPAGEGSRVGGDFYDAFESPNGWMVVIGDVGGRGVEAATLTALARYTLRSAGSLTGDPLVAVDQLDRWLRERSELSLCTAVVVLLGGDGTANVVCAGHPPPLVVQGSQVSAVQASGPLLGSGIEAERVQARVELRPGDQLVLYTDGVTEAPAEGDRFGDARLISALRDSPDPRQSIERVRAALASFGADPDEDDSAMVTVMRTGSAVKGTGSVRGTGSRAGDDEAAAAARALP